MALTLESLRQASRQPTRLRKSITEARAQNLRTVFLCHSHRDAEYVQGFLNKLDESGWQVYVDWQDTGMPSEPDRETAAIIQRKIADLYYFVFLATPYSLASKWCPWEIGFADGKKPIDQILVVPTTDSSGNFHGSEYLKLYRRIDLSSKGTLAAFNPGLSSGVYVNQL